MSIARFSSLRPNLITLILSLALVVLPNIAFSQTKTLTIFTWADYFDPELISEFEEKFDCKVHQIFFETDEAKEQYLWTNPKNDIDVIVSSEIANLDYVSRSVLAKLDFDVVANIKHIDKKIVSAFPRLKDYAVPYFWGTSGIIYRKDLVKQKVDSWKALFNPENNLRNKILMVEDSRDVVGVALKTLGYSYNSIKFDELRAANDLLKTQKPYVKNYSYLNPSDPALVDGEVWMAMIYNGDGLRIASENSNIEFVVPKEGTAFWIDYLSVLNSSDQKLLGMQFINFLNQPKIAARNAQFLQFASPNLTANQYLPPEFLADPLIYPPEEIKQVSEYYVELPVEVTKMKHSIFFSLLD